MWNRIKFCGVLRLFFLSTRLHIIHLNFECVGDKRWLISLLLKVFSTAVLHCYVKWPGLIKVGKSTQYTLPVEKEAKSSRASATLAALQSQRNHLVAQDLHSDPTCFRNAAVRSSVGLVGRPSAHHTPLLDVLRRPFL